MKNKKILSLALISIMTISLLTGCGASNDMSPSYDYGYSSGGSLDVMGMGTADSNAMNGFGGLFDSIASNKSESIAQDSYYEPQAPNMKPTEMPETEVTVTAQISCKDFYAVENNEPDTGIPTSLMEYKFTNKSSNKIESYKLTITLPTGMEPVSVMTPTDVTKYTLGENEEGQRTLSLKGAVDVAATSSFKFTFGTPFTNSTVAVVVIWALVIGISAFVLKDRLKEAK